MWEIGASGWFYYKDKNLKGKNRLEDPDLDGRII
jgi:hypothetical protein